MPSETAKFFETSPFSLVADELAAQCWSGRPHVHRRLEELISTFSRRADSSLDVVWANLGAGKTHTLFHFAHMLQSDPQRRFISAFVEMPEQVRTFADLYKRIVSMIPLDRLAEIIVASPLGKLPSNLERAGNVLKHGNDAEKQLVRAWLLAERPHLTELRKRTGIAERIEDDLAATEILQGIFKAFDYAKCRFVVLMDEFQRVGTVPPAVRNRILSSLRTVFSRTPRYFSTVIAVQSRVEKSAFDLIPPELKTLIGGRPTISLPEMDLAEAMDFVLGRFHFFRPEDYSGSAAAPFHPETIKTVLTYMQEKQIALNPREILQSLAAVYDHISDLSAGICSKEALRVLKEGYESS